MELAEVSYCQHGSTDSLEKRGKKGWHLAAKVITVVSIITVTYTECLSDMAIFVLCNF